MALPSERVTIKRKIGEEPVEALYLQSTKRQRSVNYYWNRVSDSDAPDLPVSAPSVSSTSESTRRSVPYEAQVPTIRTTSPEEDLVTGRASIFEAVRRPLTKPEDPPSTSHRPNASVPASLQDLIHEQPGVSNPNAGPRRFHFIKNSSARSSSTIGPANKVRKHRKTRRNDLPVFVENSRSMPHPRTATEIPPRIGDDINKEAVNRLLATETCKRRSRKRPIVNAEEQKWRTENWTSSTKTDRDTQGRLKTAQSIKESSSYWDYDSEVLAGQLQEVALQEIYAASDASKDDESKPQLKVQPKPPKPRRLAAKQNADVSSDDDSVMNIFDSEEDDNYVYDTYVRLVELPADGSPTSSKRNMDRLQSIDSSKIGIMIVAEEDQEEWESFAEGDQDSDKDWNSEEEDENAEDYYGNDYPEDEVNSDDEFDRGAYQYRAGASDEEEFDQGIDSWSDEDEDCYPWKHNAGTVQPKGDDDGDQDMDG